LTFTLIIFSGAGLGLAIWILSNGIPGSGASAQRVQISPEAVAQIKALLEEKRSRAGAQLKIDSQLIYELRMRSGASASLAAINHSPFQINRSPFQINH
jgi:hypothetical protein